MPYVSLVIIRVVDQTYLFVSEPDAGCHDDLGLNMSFTMVQTDFNCQVFRYSSQGLRVTDKLSSHQILFLNKNDLFERKIQTSDIKSFFPVSLFHVIRA